MVGIADPGERFNATDMVDTRFPMRRLIFGGVLNDRAFIYYEHGGFGYSHELEIYGYIQTDRPELLAHTDCDPPAVKTLLELRENLLSGRCLSQAELERKYAVTPGQHSTK